ncbi:hypothetical protein BGZ82_002982 [Podila clonocystis]|nr:hypothetical protein BGZ82_002982 [Podila clonocystis]
MHTRVRLVLLEDIPQRAALLARQDPRSQWQVALAGHSAHVFAACRSEQRATDAIEKAKQEIKTKYANAAEPKLEFLQLDLNDINNCAQAAKNFLSKGLPLHLLINNSGIMATPYALSADGIEQQLAFIGSRAASRGGIDFETINNETTADPAIRYGRSKLANILFGKALARRLKDECVYVNIAHPGFAATELARSTEEVYGKFLTVVLDYLTMDAAMKPEVGALTQLYCAASHKIENLNIRGKNFIPIANELEPNPIAFDEDLQDLQERLWTWTESIVKEKLKA